MADVATSELIAATVARSRTIARTDGRTVGYIELGSAVGRPLIHFHGTGFSSLEALTGARLANEAGVRLIAFDRPGFGGSTPLPGRDLEDVAADALALADHLGIDRFQASGFSGGVPHALATAAAAGPRCRGVVGVNTAGDVGTSAWRHVPLPARLLVRVMTIRPIARRMWPRMFADVPALLSPGASATTAALLQAAFRHGSRNGDAASLHELALFYRDGWGDPWPSIVSPVTLLHGRLDGLLPFARALAAQHRATTLIEVAGKHMDWASAATWRRLLADVS